MRQKFSRQREAIKSFLMTRKDHPTADVVYENVRLELPNISLGTVYRNLTKLSENNEIQRLRFGNGIDHFDFDISNHLHFICEKCGEIKDFPFQDCDLNETFKKITENAEKKFGGKLKGNVSYFYGTCENCINIK